MNIEEKRKQIIEEVEKLEKKLDGWKFRKGASKLEVLTDVFYMELNY